MNTETETTSIRLQKLKLQRQKFYVNMWWHRNTILYTNKCVMS